MVVGTLQVVVVKKEEVITEVCRKRAERRWSQRRPGVRNGRNVLCADETRSSKPLMPSSFPDRIWR